MDMGEIGRQIELDPLLDRGVPLFSEDRVVSHTAL